MILIWRFGNLVKIVKLTYTITDPFILQAWVSLHTVINEISQFEILSTAFFEQTAKYNVRLYSCLYSIPLVVTMAMDIPVVWLFTTVDKQYSLANPTFTTDEFPQPSIFKGQLKIYQLKVSYTSLHHNDIIITS